MSVPPAKRAVLIFVHVGKCTTKPEPINDEVINTLKDMEQLVKHYL